MLSILYIVPSSFLSHPACHVSSSPENVKLTRKHTLAFLIVGEVGEGGRGGGRINRGRGKLDTLFQIFKFVILGVRNILEGWRHLRFGID